MSHTDKIKDADALFLVDPITRQIKNVSSTKTTLMQYDHNSERFSFTIPRYIEGHDMMESTKAEVHYINVDTADVYEMTDLAIDETDDDKVTCSWLISQNATSKVGALDFLLRFSCVAEDGTIEYAWHTGIHKGITVSKGIYNTNIIVEQNADALEQIEAEIKSEVKGYVDSPKKSFSFEADEILDGEDEKRFYRIEVRDDGLYIVDSAGKEFNFYQFDYGVMAQESSFALNSDQSAFADESGFSEWAGCDPEGRPLKGIEVQDYGDIDTIDICLSDGYITSYGIVNESLIVDTNGEYEPGGFSAGLYFTTPSAIPENYSQFIGNVYFKGDSTDEGAFVPEPDTRYTIVFDFDGNLTVGYVSSIPAPPISEVTE
jgi:hypothetical protein